MLNRKHSLYIIIPALIMAAFTSCKKSELTAYDQPAQVQFYKLFDNPRKDSFVYSFAIKPATMLADTVRLPVRITGVAMDKDRMINLKAVADSSNAVEGTDYKIHRAIIRAGHYQDSVEIVVFRRPEMKDAEKKLLLEIIASADFQPGLVNTPAANDQLKLSGGSIRMLVKINDFLTKPSNWDQYLTTYFGTYSRVKYAFIIQVTGRSEFPFGATGLPFGQFGAYQTMMRQALADYVKDHGPMIDENGNTISF